MRYRFLLSTVVISGLFASGLQAADVQPLVEALRGVGAEGAGNREAIAAWQKLQEASVDQLPEILQGMDGANPLSTNWIAGAVEAIAARQLQSGGSLPADQLEAFVLDTDRSRRGRRLAYDLLLRVDPTASNRLIPQMLHDPSVDFRRDAVARLLEQAEPLFEAEKKDEAVALYREALSGARDLDQIKTIAERLKSLDQTVDLPRHFGFVMTWHLIGPFDHTGSTSFDVAYPPESEIDLSATYEGKEGAEVRWIEHTTEDEYGLVDLNKAIAKHNGAIAYAVATFESDEARDVQLRLGCINANKIWLNGELLHAREAYHAGSEIDQYVGEGRLKAGQNVILLKVCQNEQTESWAQDWQFQLRVCDGTGTAILARDRLARASDQSAE